MGNFRRAFDNIPPVTKNLILINLVVWLAMMVAGRRADSTILDFGGLHYFEASDFNVLQIFTYMFMHSTANFAHILFNMFTLFMFGILLERTLGAKRFLFYYISCGIGAALVKEAVWAMTWEGIFAKMMHVDSFTFQQILAHSSPEQISGALNSFVTIGASGAIFGVLLAFGMLFPNLPTYIMFIPVPIKAKWMVIGYGVLELFIGMSEANDGVAHFAHLGGMLFGFFIILYWKKKNVIHGGF